MDEYPLIEHHGLIGDLQAAALVTTDATIDWFCLCTFMYVDALARAGRVDQARLSWRRCSSTPTIWACTRRRWP